MEELTLNEWMEKNAEDGVIYHIGAKLAYFFVGTKEEYFRDVNKATARYLNFLNTQLITNRQRLNSGKMIGKHFTFSPNDFLDGKDGLRKCVERKIKELWGYSNYLYCAYRAAERFSKEIDAFTPFPTRKVIESYPRITEGIAVIVEGIEESANWDRSEYLANTKGENTLYVEDEGEEEEEE